MARMKEHSDDDDDGGGSVVVILPSSSVNLIVKVTYVDGSGAAKCIIHVFCFVLWKQFSNSCRLN